MITSFFLPSFKIMSMVILAGLFNCTSSSQWFQNGICEDRKKGCVYGWVSSLFITDWNTCWFRPVFCFSGELVLWSVCLQVGWSDIWLLQDSGRKVGETFAVLYWSSTFSYIFFYIVPLVRVWQVYLCCNAIHSNQGVHLKLSVGNKKDCGVTQLM